jgi:hypothetical protein
VANIKRSKRIDFREGRWEWGKRSWYVRLVGLKDHEHMSGAVGRPYDPDVNDDTLLLSWYAFPDYPKGGRQFGPFRTLRHAFRALGLNRRPRITGFPPNARARRAMTLRSMGQAAIIMRLGRAPRKGSDIANVIVGLRLPDGKERRVGVFSGNTKLRDVRRLVRRVFRRIWNCDKERLF